MLYVHNFASSMRTSDIVRHFAPFGRVFVQWLDDVSLFLTLEDKTLAPLVRPRPHRIRSSCKLLICPCRWPGACPFRSSGTETSVRCVGILHLHGMALRNVCAG